VLQHHCHVSAPATVSIKADSSTFGFAGQLCVAIRSEELEAGQLQRRVRIDPHSHVSVKHRTEDEEK